MPPLVLPLEHFLVPPLVHPLALSLVHPLALSLVLSLVHFLVHPLELCLIPLILKKNWVRTEHFYFMCLCFVVFCCVFVC